jgi:RNA polymerase sigma-32 factor
MNLGITPDVKLLSDNLGVSEKAVMEMDQRLASGQEVSLDKPLDDDGGRHVFADLISQDHD